MSHRLASLLLPLGLAVAACGGDDDDSGAPDAAAAATCERGVLEADTELNGPLAGPAVDRATGQLREPPPAGYHVSTTYLQIRPDGQQRFGELVAPIVQQLASQRGLLALQLATSDECGTARTLGIWEDEGAMFEFSLGDVHQAAVGSIDEISRGASAFSAWTATALDQTTWEVAAQRLAEVEGPLY